MKIFPIILILIVITQIALPCCAGSDHCESEQTERSQKQQDNHDCEYSCTGLCCGISFTIESNSLEISAKMLNEHNFSFNYHFDYAFDYLNRTWHPPAFC